MRKVRSQFAATNYTSLLHGSFETLVARGGDFTFDLARKLCRRLKAHGFSGGMVEDQLERMRERDQEIKSLNASLNESLIWGRGFNRKGKRR